MIFSMFSDLISKSLQFYFIIILTDKLLYLTMLITFIANQLKKSLICRLSHRDFR